MGRLSLIGAGTSGVSRIFAAAQIDLDLVNTQAWSLGAILASPLAVARATPANAGYENAAGVVSYFAANTPRYGDRGLLVEEARTNLCLQASDFTNASWVKSNLTTAKTATGPDGITNSASTLTATAGNATALQAITSGSATRITSVYLKRRTGTGNIDLTQDNGSTWTTQTITSAWARYNLSSVSSANPTVGLRIVTSGDAVDVFIFQHELGAFITSPVVTTSAAVTRAADVVTFSDLTWFDGTSESFYVEWTGKGVANANLFTLDAADDVTLNEQAGISPKLADASATYAITTATTGVAGNVLKAAGRLKTNDIALCLNGGTVGTDTAATQPGTLAAARLGIDLAGANALNSYIRRFSAWKTVQLTNAQLQALTT